MHIAAGVLYQHVPLIQNGHDHSLGDPRTG